MRYLGGKARIAKYLAHEIRKRCPNLPFWDAFCGSLAMSKALGGPGVASDICVPLIAMYREIDAGWEPPTELSPEDWARAKTLPDSDPLKAFAGFACSYRGLWFSGYAGGYVGPNSGPGAAAGAKVLLRDVALCRAAGVIFQSGSFFDIQPFGGLLVYLDPPYRGTTAYDAVSDFDHERFLIRAREWADAGSKVFISEYSLPIGRCIFEHSRARMLAASGRAVERLFEL